MRNIKKERLLLFTLLQLFVISNLYAQNIFQGYEHLFVAQPSYVVMHTSVAPIIDGKIDDEIWSKVQWTEYFSDIEGKKENPCYKTRAKMMWDDECLYIAVDMEEPHVWANLTKRDEIIFLDNSLEIFIDPTNTTHRYFEIEINALNTIFDLFLTKSYRNGGGVLHAWNAPGMRHAVHIEGSINDPRDIDKGWSIELAIPLRAFAMKTDKRPPRDLDIWRLNFSRVEWEVETVEGKYIKRKAANGDIKSAKHSTWSPQGVVNMHYPERWGYLQFSRNKVGMKIPKFNRPYSECQQDYLWLIYYKQQDFLRKNKRYARSLQELELPLEIYIEYANTIIKNRFEMQATDYQFFVFIKDENQIKISLNHEGLVIR